MDQTGPFPGWDSTVLTRSPQSGGEGQLAGFRIGVTSSRRSGDLIDALERRGASVFHAPAVGETRAADDVELQDRTRAIIAARPDVVVLTTDYGLRRWSEASDAAGLGGGLADMLGSARLHLRDRAVGEALRAAGPSDVGSGTYGTTAALVDHLLGQDLSQITVGVQLQAPSDVEQVERLRRAGARVLTVTPYPWTGTEGSGRLVRLIEAVCAGQIDCVTFTSPQAVDVLLGAAAERGLLPLLLQRFRYGVLAAAVGPATAQPLLAAGTAVIVPDRFQSGAMIRLVCDHLAEYHVEQLCTPAGQVEVRGRSVRVDDVQVDLAPAQLVLFKALLSARGAVLSREALTGLLSHAGAGHALDMNVNRLRKCLPDARMIETVVKRGYRLHV